MSQCDRVLALLRARGDAGLNTSELQELPIVDGGAPILRLAARIDNLKARGFGIVSARESNGTATYRLLSEPGVEQQADAAQPIPALSEAEQDRFWSYVRKGASCWEWLGTQDGKGYGQFWFGPNRGAAHRISYELLAGPIPEGLQIDHLCRNPACVNPAHLEPVTSKENTLRGVGVTAQNARKTHCKHGHPFDETSSRVDGTGRICRVCQRISALEAKAAKRAAKMARRVVSEPDGHGVDARVGVDGEVAGSNPAPCPTGAGSSAGERSEPGPPAEPPSGLFDSSVFVRSLGYGDSEAA